MAMLSLREAAQLCGRGKSTVQTAIKEGKLSAGRNEKGGYEIDPSELHRVFPFAVSNDEKKDITDRTEQDADGHAKLVRPVVSGPVQRLIGRTGQVVSETQMRVKHLEELLAAEKSGREDLKEALEARVSDLQNTVADLRKRLDQAEEEKMRLLPPPNSMQGAPVPERRGLWARLTGR